MAHAAEAGAKKKNFGFRLPAAARRVHRCNAVGLICLQQVLQDATASPLAQGQVKVWSPLCYMATPGTRELHSAEGMRVLAWEPRIGGPTPRTSHAGQQCELHPYFATLQS